jgi:hypothetical protein
MITQEEDSSQFLTRRRFVKGRQSGWSTPSGPVGPVFGEKGYFRETSVPRVPVLLLFVVTLAGLILALAGSAEADTLTVTNTNNTGSGSLRSAIEQADASAGADTIRFAGNLGATIRLTSSPLTINSNLTIEGPGARELSVSGTDNSRVFTVASGATVRIQGLTITGGNADSGGGINNMGTLTLAKSAVSGNLAGGSGGGIFNGGTLTVSRSTISGNTADEGGGGGVLNRGTVSGVEGNATFINSTISRNSSEGSGGGISNAGEATIRNSTVTRNSAEGSGGGVASVGTGSVRVYSSILAGNQTTDVDNARNGSFSSLGYNIVGDGTSAPSFNSTGDQTGVANPGLGPLANNGGPTQTHAVLNGSPALDKGDGGSARDQRGMPRPVDLPRVGNARGGDGADVGAFELQAGA